MQNTNVNKAILDEELAKSQPDYLYEGEIPADNDAMDYVNLPMKGVRLG